MTHSLPTQIKRGLAVSLVLHVVVLAIGWVATKPDKGRGPIDIEIAPAPPKAELLPPERPSRFEHEDPAPSKEALAATEVKAPEPVVSGDGLVDAGVPDAPPPDAAVPDAAPVVAVIAPDAAPVIAATDAAPVAVETGGGGGDGSGSGGGSGPGGGSDGDAPPVIAATVPTSIGMTANLIDYFPPGQGATVLIRFDRLRGTEWTKQTERLFHPMPDYRELFGKRDADIGDKLETLVIASTDLDDVTATTLVGRTRLLRTALREFLGKVAPVEWSASRAGLLGRRTKTVTPADARVFVSPFRGWFVFARPEHVGDLGPSAVTDLDAVEASVKLPPWLSGIRSIEGESGVASGPALVVTIALSGKRQDLGDDDYGLGVAKFPTPTRISVAAELDPQGWLVRGNMKFASAAEATEFVTAALAVQERINDSRILQAALGKSAANVVRNLSLARTGERVSYGTSISIADMRAIMAVAAAQLDRHFAGLRGAAPP
ncbi:MAG: hypothetical protein KF773_32735 [Deltaproteobacteria bacterium]|nr:hypothetical protein [Deltaproteobacteria bacterium]